MAAAAAGRFAVPAAEAVPRAAAIMDDVYGTGDTPKPYSEYKGRYLWTDAHGVCNFVSLARETGDARYLDRADALIDDVHATLGRGRDAARTPLGRPDAPLAGGLRIGKVADEEEPDGDGQYAHYLTKWAVALNRMTLARGDAHYNDAAIQLMKAMHRHFVWSTPGGTLHMHWKMSVDLRRPVVLSEGNLDPFDCLATYKLLQSHASAPEGALRNEIADASAMVQRKTPSFVSTDPLDLGEALQTAAWHPDEPWARVLTERSLLALEMLWRRGAFEGPRSRRLAFRELGAAIGAQVNRAAASVPWAPRVRAIQAAWAGDLHSRDRDITPVMFATSLLPGAFTRCYDALPPVPRGAARKEE